MAGICKQQSTTKANGAPLVPRFDAIASFVNFPSEYCPDCKNGASLRCSRLVRNWGTRVKMSLATATVRISHTRGQW